MLKQHDASHTKPLMLYSGKFAGAQLTRVELSATYSGEECATTRADFKKGKITLFHTQSYEESFELTIEEAQGLMWGLERHLQAVQELFNDQMKEAKHAEENISALASQVHAVLAWEDDPLEGTRIYNVTVAAPYEKYCLKTPSLHSIQQHLVELNEIQLQNERLTC